LTKYKKRGVGAPLCSQELAMKILCLYYTTKEAYMAKRFYWIKLMDSFFDDDRIKLLEEMDNGKDYVIFLLKLRLKSINHKGLVGMELNGVLYPYNEKMLATITNTNIDIVRSALSAFQRLGLVTKLDDGMLYMEQVEELLGSETDSAQRMRKLREKEKSKELDASQCDVNVRELPSQCDVENASQCDRDIDIDIEIDKDTEKEKTFTQKQVLQRENGKPPYDKILEYYHSILPELPRVAKLTDRRKKMINARWKEYDDLDFWIEFFNHVRDSKFLMGKTSDFKAGFDFLLSESTFYKTLEGNYHNGKKYAGLKALLEEDDAKQESVCASNDWSF